MIRNKRLIWQLYPSYLAITLIAVLAIFIYSTGSIRTFFLSQAEAGLLTQARLMEKQMERLLAPMNMEAIDLFCKEVGKKVDTRITVILPAGQVIGDSEEIPIRMDNHGNRPEVLEALHSNKGSSVRYSGTLQQNMLYIAIPLIADNKTVAVLRTSLAITYIDNEIKSIQIRFTWWGVFITLLAAVVIFFLSRKISRPIEEITKGAEKYAKGDLKHRLVMPQTLELARLAKAMNKMSIQLEERIETVVTQRNEYESVLSSMTEGVIAVDTEERILSLNRAAISILGIEIKKLAHQNLQEMIRNPVLQEYTQKTLKDGQSIEGDITLFHAKDRIIHVRCSAILSARGKLKGALVVMSEVTKLRKLENMRQDFVANVSHEIKTPLTTIKGFVETLLHGDGIQDPKESKRFMQIIERHVDRLHILVEDLLSLARIEKLDDEKELSFMVNRVKNNILTAIQIIQTKASEKNITFQIDTDEKLMAEFDNTLLEQALVNLLDNAVKFSPKGSSIRIHTQESDTCWRIAITDDGPGIPEESLPRIFERFYRVDKARSRNLGGTGLGLAIVKHIAQLHMGKVSVDSTVNKGSTFTIELPKKPNPSIFKDR